MSPDQRRAGPDKRPSARRVPDMAYDEAISARLAQGLEHQTHTLAARVRLPYHTKLADTQLEQARKRQHKRPREAGGRPIRRHAACPRPAPPASALKCAAARLLSRLKIAGSTQ